MATIALYANQINQMGSRLSTARKDVDSFRKDLLSLRSKMGEVDRGICNLESEMADVKSTSDTQELKSGALSAMEKAVDDFIDFADRTDRSAADYINRAKADFYKKYSWLKPESEKSGWEKFCDGLKKAGEWCKEHWKEIAITVAIVIGCILSVAAVICTGGAALAPLLAGILTWLGVASGTAMTIATVASMTVAVIAVVSTVVSSALNIADTWGNYDSPLFNTIQSVFNWTSAISNVMYSIGSVYCGVKGITNSSLQEYSKAFRTSSQFRQSVWGMGKGDLANLCPGLDQARFWSQIGQNGDKIAKGYTQQYGGKTLESLIEEFKINPPKFMDDPMWWKQASATLAGNSSGEVVAWVGRIKIDSVWNTTERILLNINPSVVKITIMKSPGVITEIITKSFSIPSLWTGIAGAAKAYENFFLELGRSK